jgi:hypothetical protein
MRHSCCWGFLCVALLGCKVRAAQIIEPLDMSATAHDEAARAEQMEAMVHLEAAEFYPDDGVRGCHDVGIVYFPCWSQMANLVEYNLWEAKQHQRRAKEHIAAAVMLRDAENRTCQNISMENREISPFYHRADIAAVHSAVSMKTSAEMIGADIVFRAVPGMTRQNLQQIIDCQMARNAALGYDESWMPDCPLMLPGITATVQESEGGLVVSLRSKDPRTAAELNSRALLLLQGED